MNMHAEQSTTVRGIVRAIEGDAALVEVEQGGCGRCHEEGGCGGQNLTQMFCSGPKSYQVANTFGAALGERVLIAVPAGSVRRTANLAYGLPLLGIIGGAALGTALAGDGGGVAGALLGGALVFAWVRRQTTGGAGKFSPRPHIVDRLDT